MFSSNQYKEMYEKFMGPLAQAVTLRLNNGTGFTSYPSKAHVSRYNEQDLVQGGPIELGDMKLIILAEDIPVGVTRMDKGDRVGIDGRDYGVIHWDNNTRSVGAEVIAVNVTVRG